MNDTFFDGIKVQNVDEPKKENNVFKTSLQIG